MGKGEIGCFSGAKRRKFVAVSCYTPMFSCPRGVGANSADTSVSGLASRLLRSQVVCLLAIVMPLGQIEITWQARGLPQISAGERACRQEEQSHVELGTYVSDCGADRGGIRLRRNRCRRGLDRANLVRGLPRAVSGERA